MRITYGLIAALALAAGMMGVLGLSAVFAEEEEEVSLDQVPATVRATIEQHAGQNPIAKIERESEGGQVVYEVEQEVDGKEVEFQVSATGEYLGPEAEEADDDEGEDDENEAEEESEQAVPWDQLPKPVQDGLRAILGTVVPEKVTREDEEGLTEYEAEFTENGTEHSITISENGDVLESEEEIAPSALPAAVVEQLASIAPNAEIKEAELVTVTFYEVELKAHGKTRELRILANGQRLDDDD
ncbi:MAG: PepSY-like domain-containing protein [Candidatus Hydrogenedentes bacterium]|nr:PepSY-like domain-containing protein [Candidatus Hydrogenedentota bacterium]